MTVLGREDTELLVRLLSAIGLFRCSTLLRPVGRELVSQIFASWNQLYLWIRAVDDLRRVA
jgi:hypothetical protein